MAIDSKSIQVCLWKVVSFSMKICCDFVKKYPAFSSVTFFFFILYVFLPRVFVFLIYSVLIFISTVGVYRVFFSSDHRSIVDVKSCKKNDGGSSVDGEDRKMGTNRSISANSQAARTRNVNEKDRKDNTGTSNVEEKSKVCSVKCDDGVVDKSAVIEENPKDIKEAKVDSVADGVKCSARGSKEETERSEDIREDGDNDGEWTADDQKNDTDLENSEVERYKRLESMMARRKVRKLLSLNDRNTLMSPANNDHVDQLASILVPRSNPYVFNNSKDVSSPGSAPSVLLPMHNPFDIPYETNEERPNLMGDDFHQEFLAENHQDLMLCRHESFRWGAFFSLDAMEDECDIFSHDIPFKPKAPQKLKNPLLGSDLENKNVGEAIGKGSSQEKEAMSIGGSGEDHATQHSQASQQAPDSVGVHHEEDKREIQRKEMRDENITEKSFSSSSSEENLPICRPNKDAILRSLTSRWRNIVLPKDDDKEVNGSTNNSDQSMRKDSKIEDQFFYAAGEIDLSRCNSLASDLQVQISGISTPRSISSPHEEYSTHDMKNEDDFGSEEIGEISSHLSLADTGHESYSRQVPEVSDQQDIYEVGVSGINQKADLNTPDMLPENVVAQNSVNSNSLSPSRTGLPDCSQTCKRNFNIDASSSSLEGDNRSHTTIYDCSNSEIPTNNHLENLNTTNDMDNGAHEGIVQPRDLPGSSGGINSNSSNHQSPLDSSTQIQQNERGESCNDSEEVQNSFADNRSSVQSNYSSRSLQNGPDEVVSEHKFPASSAEHIRVISSPCSPKLQPKFSRDQVSSTNLSQGTSIKAQKSNNQIVEDDLVHEVPPLRRTHSAPLNASLETDDSTFQVPHDAEKYQSPRFLDAVSCVPFRPKLEERQDHDPSTPTNSSRFIQEVQEPYPHQNSSNHESDTNNFVDKLVVNENKSSSGSVETNEGENESSLKWETASGFVEPSNSSGSKSTEDTKGNPREIDTEEGVVGTSKDTEENAKSGPDVKMQEFQEAKLNDGANQQKAADAKDNSLGNKALEKVSEPKQTELTDGSSNPVRHVDTKEPLDPFIERRSMKAETQAVSKSGEVKAIDRDAMVASQSVLRLEDVPADINAISNSKSTNDVKGTPSNHSEVEITVCHHN